MWHQYAIINLTRITWELHQTLQNKIQTIAAAQRTFIQLTIPSLHHLKLLWIQIGIWIYSGASYHITNISNNLGTVKKYVGKNNLIVGNGQEVAISHVGNSILHLPNKHKLKLKNIIYSPHIKKNLLSVFALTSQNPVVVEFDSIFFL